MKGRRVLTPLLLVSLILVLVTIPLVGSYAKTAVSQTEPLVKINEIMFDPHGEDEGNEWLELYNAGTGPESLSGWTISNRDGTAAITLPSWDLPADCYLVVFFGIGTNDSDFSDGSGSFYTGGSAEIFNNTEDEVGLYTGSPSSGNILDFVSWSSDGAYNPGQAHDYAVSAGIWSSGEYFDTGFPTGKSIWDGNSIGRDKSSTDVEQPDDWDSSGGADAYYQTPGAKNTGPLYSVDNGIKLTQLRANLFLMQWENQVTYGNHTILEELQTDDETYVKAVHYFETNLDGVVYNTFSGVGEYHWYKVNSSAWREEINFLLATSDLSENFSMNYTKESVNGDFIKTINENVSVIYSYETFETGEPYPDDEVIPDISVSVIEETYSSNAITTLTQTDSNRYHVEIVQQVDDRGILWDVSFVKDELVSYANAEAWTTLDLTSNVEEPTTISTHYNMSLGEGWLDGGIGDLNVSYEDYSVVLGDKTFMLDGPGYMRMEKVSDSRLDVLSNIQIGNVGNVSETLDLGNSGNLELLIISGEEVIKGYFIGNTVPKVYQFYIDGQVGTGVGAFLCGATGLLLSTYVIAPAEATNPIGWFTLGTRLLITGGAALGCAIAGNAVEPDKTDPVITFADIDHGGCEGGGWHKLKVTIKDDSDLSKIRVKVKSITTGSTLWDKTYGYEDSPYEHIWILTNDMCVPSAQVITVTATDNSASKNEISSSYPAQVPARCCCGDGVIDLEEKCDPPKDNSEQCPQTTEQCEDHKTVAFRDEYGDCDANCQCKEDYWAVYTPGPICVKGKCGAECATDEDCKEKGEDLVCDLEKCICTTKCGNGKIDEGEKCDRTAVPTGCGCGNSIIDPSVEYCTEDCQSCWAITDTFPEQCDPPMANSEQCENPTCVGPILLEYSDDYGNCIACICVPDIPYRTLGCAFECGAECQSNADCGPGELCIGCFCVVPVCVAQPILTYGDGTPMVKELDTLRDFRDECLLTNPVGQAFVSVYYKVSPPMAEFIIEHPALKPVVRAGLLPVVAIASVATNIDLPQKMAVGSLLVLVPLLLVGSIAKNGGSPGRRKR